MQGNMGGGGGTHGTGEGTGRGTVCQKKEMACEKTNMGHLN